MLELQKPKQPHLYTFVFSENYKAQVMLCWEVTHQKCDHTIAKFNFELSHLHTLVKSRKYRITKPNSYSTPLNRNVGLV